MPRQQHTPHFGARLKALRFAAGLTQEALAERASLSVRGLQDLERIQNRRPHHDTIELLATALGLTGSDRASFLAEARPQPLGTGRPAPTPPPQPGSARALVPLVGRAREQGMLDRFLRGTDDPLEAAPVLLLAGEPGMGKTRLLQAAAQLAIAQGWCVLVGGCHRRGGQEPYAPVLDALARHLHAEGQDQLPATLTGCAWLVRLLPELAPSLEPLPAVHLAPEQERRLVFAAVTRLLANVAGPAGTLLVLDDLQWAGPDALDLLGTMLHTGTPSLRVVGAYRDTEVRPADPLGLLLADLAQARLVRQHTLGPLTIEEAADLLNDLLVDLAEGDRGLVAGVVRQAAGTPFFLISYAQALRQGSMAGVPWDIAQGVRQRVALLPTAGQELLGVAAIVGRHATRELLVTVTGQPEEAVLGGLETACRARLLLEDGRNAYLFAHDVVREVVEADLSMARRAVLHRKVAEALEGDQVGVSPETLAYHYARTDIVGKAVLYLEQAGDHAWGQRAHAAAAGHYREALDRLKSLGRRHDTVRVREKLGEAHTRVGGYEAALRVLEPAADHYRVVGDSEGLGRVAAGIAEATVRSASDEAMARLRVLLEQVERGGASVPPAALYLWWGVCLISAIRYDEALVALERATELARADGDGRTLVRAATHRADILQRSGQLGEALRAYREALTLTEAMGDLEALVSVHRDLALIYGLQGALAAGKQHSDRSLALAEQLENQLNRSFTLVIRGWLAVLSGDSRAAHADLDQARALSGQHDQSWYSPYVLTYWARLYLVEGDWPAATAALREALALAEGSGDLQALRLAATTMAEVEILADRAEVARARLIPLLDRPGLQECNVTELLPVLAWAQLELGQMDLAAATAEEALTRARSEQMQLVLVEALRVQTLIALRQRDWIRAEATLAEALTLAREIPYPYAGARLLHLAGVLHTELGEPELARQLSEEALACFTRLGARMDIERVERALQASRGHRSRTKT